MSVPATPVTPAAHVATANTAVAAPVPVSPAVEQENDVVESIALVAPIVLPIVGGVLMFLLAFIAVVMA